MFLFTAHENIGKVFQNLIENYIEKCTVLEGGVRMGNLVWVL